jgi:hypothetical protein
MGVFYRSRSIDKNVLVGILEPGHFAAAGAA